MDIAAVYALVFLVILPAVLAAEVGFVSALLYKKPGLWGRPVILFSIVYLSAVALAIPTAAVISSIPVN